MVKDDFSDKLYSEAQSYGFGNQLKEKLTPSGWKRMLGEGLSSSFKERMELLREADKAMREEAGSLKGNLKNVNNAFKENRFVDVAHWVAEIDQTVQKLSSYSKAVTDLEDADLHEYYTRTQDADIFKDYFGKKAEIKIVIKKQADLSDFFNKMLGNSFEKTYWKRIKERKLGVQSLVKQTERIVNTVLVSLKKMGDARATGNIGGWIAEVERISKASVQFHEYFKTIYEKHIADLAAMLRSREPVSTFDEVPENVESPVAEVPVESVSAPSGGETIPMVPGLKTDKPKFDDEERKEPGRPTRGDSKRQHNQLEQLLNQLKKETPDLFNKPEQTKPVEPVVEPVAEIKPIEETKPVEEVKVEPSKPVEVQKTVEQKIPNAVVEEIKEIVNKEPEITVSDDDLEPEVKVEEKVVEPAKTEEKIIEPVKTEPGKVEEVKPVMQPVQAPQPAQTPTEAPRRGRGRPPKNPGAQPTNPAQPTVKPTNKPGAGKKVIMIITPKNRPDGLDVLGQTLEKEFGHQVVFVGADSVRDRAQSLIDQGYEVDVKPFEEVKSYIKSGPTKEELLGLLDDPDFVKKLHRLGNGDFHFGEVFDMPEFSNLEPDTKKAIQKKLIDVRVKEIDSAKENASKPTEEIKSDSGPTLEEDLLADPNLDEDEKIYLHTGKVQDLIGRPLKDLSEQDFFDLLKNDKYKALLPKTSDGRYDLELIKKFPEYTNLSEDYQGPFIGSLNMENKEILKKRKSATHEYFFAQLKKVADAGDFGLAAAMLCSYSEELESTDPKMSAKLLSYAEKLLND